MLDISEPRATLTELMFCVSVEYWAFPDSGIYYVPARQAVISEVLDRQILSSVGSYALCMVSFYAGDGDV